MKNGAQTEANEKEKIFIGYFSTQFLRAFFDLGAKGFSFCVAVYHIMPIMW